jgi:predicted metalloprotease with PDZ domain
MARIIYFITAFLFFSWSFGFSQHPLNGPQDAVEIRYSQAQPVIGYTLQVDTADLSSFTVEMRIRNVSDTFRIAMMAHPEYDDRFWRFVEGIRVETNRGSGTVLSEDSALWRIVTTGNEVTIKYKIHLPKARPGPRGSWRPFLSPTGGLVGGPHSFMYVLGATLAPAYVTLKIPHGWKAVTGLTSTADPTIFFAPSVGILVDSPILIGHFKSWQFIVDEVPHKVVYWSPDAVLFDTTTLVTYIQKFVRQAARLFGRLPYREYSFLLQDGAHGALEHSNSVTLGVSGSELAKNVAAYLGEVTHEFFHTWNLIRIRPAEFGDVTYKAPPLSRGLWWSEGMTMFYADLLSRRARIPTYDSTRINHLEQLIERYYDNPGNAKISPEQASLAAFGPPGMLGDYSASTHLQGELLGTMLDLIINDETNGKCSIDNVMQKMMGNFSGPQGFTNKDVENLIQKICERSVHTFFEDYIYGNRPIDFNSYLGLAGMRIHLTWRGAVDEAYKPLADQRVYAFQSPGESTVRLGIIDPSGCWGKAGIHTGDVILSVNKSAIKSVNDFRQEIRRAKIGDRVPLEIQRPFGIIKTTVTILGYRQSVIHIEQINEATERQQKLRTAWIDSASLSPR